MLLVVGPGAPSSVLAGSKARSPWCKARPLVASLLLVVRPGAPSVSGSKARSPWCKARPLLLVVRPGAPSVRPGAPSSVLAPSSKARSP